MPPKHWQELVQELLAHAVTARDSAAGMTLKAFRAAPTTMHTVAGELTRMGEVVSAIPPEVQQRFPTVPWGKMTDLGNIVIHAGSRSDEKMLWEISQRETPHIINALGELMGD